VHTLVNDQEKLITFFADPAARWIRLRTTNAIESTVVTVNARARTTKATGSRQTSQAMAFNFLLDTE
jgi:transposase-like protein